MIEDRKPVKRFLNGLPYKYFHMVASLKQTIDLITITFEEIIGRMKAFGVRISLNKKSQGVKSEQQLLLTFEEWEAKKRNDKGYDRGRGATESSQRGRGKSTRRGKEKEHGKEKRDRSKLKCYRCDGLGHFFSECTTRKKNEETSNLVQAEMKPVLYMAVQDQIVFLKQEGVNPKKFDSSPHKVNTWFIDKGASNHVRDTRVVY
ncbi:putative transcription factor interactor and regulator CCHC(Zn) family [Helianthus annuus]|nr:putative transcription factor interactor and regulator CCHC(Zn) family [Helianthus annuus]